MKIHTGEITAQSVIDKAIKENMISQYLMFIFASVSFCIGVFCVIYSIMVDKYSYAMISTFSGLVFIPSLKFISKSRKENLAIRLLEVPLSRADTAKQAAEALCQYFCDSKTSEAKVNIEKYEKVDEA